MKNIEVIHIKKRIQKLKKERDELFSVIDEVPFDEQLFLLEGIKDITEYINSYKNKLRKLVKYENN